MAATPTVSMVKSSLGKSLAAPHSITQLQEALAAADHAPGMFLNLKEEARVLLEKLEKARDHLSEMIRTEDVLSIKDALHRAGKVKFHDEKLFKAAGTLTISFALVFSNILNVVTTLLCSNLSGVRTCKNVQKG